MDHPPTCYEYPWPSHRCHRNWVKNITKLTSNINWSRRLPYPSRHSQILCQVNPPQRPYNKHHNRPLWLKPRLPLFQDPVCMTTDWSFLPHTHTHPPPSPNITPPRLNTSTFMPSDQHSLTSFRTGTPLSEHILTSNPDRPMTPPLLLQLTSTIMRLIHHPVTPTGLGHWQ